jgi:hypothetical protein
MAMFHLDTAFMLEVIAFAAGLTLLHFGRAGAAILLRTAGAVLIVASLASAACTIYYGIRYHVQGEFDHAYGEAPGCGMQHSMMHGPAGMSGMHGMGGMHGTGGMHGMHGMPGMGGGPGMMGAPGSAAAGAPATEPPAGGAPAPGSDQPAGRQPAQ